MNTLTWIVILGILGAIAYKNWEKIKPMLQGLQKPVSNRTKDTSINPEEIKKAREERKRHLMNQKEVREKKVREMTRHLRNEIREIEIELQVIEQTENQTYH